jgi:predicted nucleotidyltransferase
VPAKPFFLDNQALLSDISREATISRKVRQSVKKPLTREKIEELLRQEMPRLKKAYGVKRLAVYGSYAKGLHTEESDVDLLVELERPLGFEFISLANGLEELLDRKVDLVTLETFRRNQSNPRYRKMVQEIQRTLDYV